MRIDRYILSKFIPIFVGAFMICLFVFMMQFTWSSMDDLIGKGLTLDILAQFFWYMGLALLPQALPLSVLLASLITFGNMGEDLELTAMKAAGMPLVRIMAPLIVFCTALAGGSFYFQNSIGPQAHVDMRQLLFSVKEQSPAVEIPEGIFYNGVPGVNLFVEHKNAETGMLYQCIIYKTDQGFERAQIVLADSGRMEMTADKQHLILDLWSGEQFQNLRGQNAGAGQMLRNANEPYARETFAYKELVIDFDANFQMMDKELLSGMPSAKNMAKIEHDADSLENELDSLARTYYTEASERHFRLRTDSARTAKAFTVNPKHTASGIDLSLKDRKPFAKHGKAAEKNAKATAKASTAAVPFDTLFAALPADIQKSVRATAAGKARIFAGDMEWKATVMHEGDVYLRRHWIEWHQKCTFALACLMFFFVGAPLGAIIRKGGLGLPTIISVSIFIFYFIINNTGMKMVRDGSVDAVVGMWASTVILLPFGIFITYQANRDSVVFNFDEYRKIIRRMLGLRDGRNLSRKEVIIEDPREDVMHEALGMLAERCDAYRHSAHLLRLPSYIKIFFRSEDDREVEEISEQLEAIVEELANSRSVRLLTHLNEMPILYIRAHRSPFRRRRWNVAAGVCVPLGFLYWLRIWRFRLRLYRDLYVISETARLVQKDLRSETAPNS